MGEKIRTTRQVFLCVYANAMLYLGGVRGCEGRLLADLAVSGARVDGVHHHALRDVRLHLVLQQPRVRVHSNLQQFNVV